MTRLWGTLFAIPVFMLSPMAMGFAGDEHREISDLALFIAVEINCPQTATPHEKKCKKIRGTIEALSAEKETLLSYGRINEVVDFMHYPEQVFNENLYPASKEALNPHIKQLLSKKSRYLVLFDYLSASSHNERHFQEDLLKSLNILHEDAVNDARNENIFRALVRSAMSDHFLNDYFAPGHITTPRENSHDTVALSMHDWANRAGTCFQITGENWPELDKYLQFIAGYRGDFGDFKFLFHKIKHPKIANENLTMCGNTADFDLEGMTQKDVQSSIIRNLTANHGKIFLQGDDRLVRNPKQKLFMLLVQVQSISEVIGSFIDCQNTPACKDIANSVTNYEWSDSYNPLVGKIAPPTAKIRYGEYEIKENDETETVYFFLKRPRYAYPAVADNAFLLSFGGQSLRHEPARFEMQFEVFPMRVGTAIPSWRNRMIQRPSSECKVHKHKLCNIGFAYGITHFRRDDFRSTGGQIRVIKAFPKISGQFSLILRRGKYEGRGVDAWRNAYGFRYDHGFSLHSFYIGFQRDYGFDGGGQFGRQNVVTFGWSLTFPSSRFLGLFGGYK